MTRLFISHASEDKEAVARPLAKMLKDRGFDVWFDDYSLKLGDSLRQEIERGLRSCDYGVVILSPSFFEKQWTQFELDGLVAREIQKRGKVILPVWHQVDFSDVVEHSPPLAARVATSTDAGLEAVSESIETAVVVSSDVSKEPEGPRPPSDPQTPLDTSGYWDLEVTSCGITDRRGYRYLLVRGYLDFWHHSPAEQLMFAHLRTAFPENIYERGGRSWFRPRLFNVVAPKERPKKLPKKSGKIGDFLFDLDPAHCIRIRRLYDSGSHFLLYRQVAALRFAGERFRRIEVRERTSGRSLLQFIFDPEFDSDLIPPLIRLGKSWPHIGIEDFR